MTEESNENEVKFYEDLKSGLRFILNSSGTLLRGIKHYTFIRQGANFGFDIDQQLSFNISEAPVVNVKRLVG